jgi:glucosamine-6-phosphate deaminase
VRLVVVEDAAQLAFAAADVITASVQRALSLALPTGETPRGVYEELARRKTPLSHVQAFNLDEYVGLDERDPLSCAAFMRAHAWDPLELTRHDIPDGRAADLLLECERYERAIADAGLGLAVLGIGRNGHLAMNEPGSAFDSRTRVVTLDARSLADNARLYPPGSKLPSQGITMGLATIAQAQALLLLAFGAKKAQAIAAALEGPVDPACPASMVQAHRDVTVIVDRAAAVGLARGPR